MFIPRTNKLQHKILNVLYSKQGEQLQIKTEDIWISAEELASIIDIPVHELRMIAAPLVREEEIDFDNSGGVLYYHSHKKTASALIEKKYLKAGKKSVNDSIFDITKWVVPLLVAFATVYTNLVTTSDNKQNKKNIEELNKEVQLLKKAAKFETQPKKYPVLPSVK